MPEINIDVKEIMKVLPHRPPFLLIDKIVEISEDYKKVVAIKNVTMNEPFFLGHFPGFPIMPGVLIVEAMAQTGAYGMLSNPDNKGKIALFAAIDGVRFRKPVVPGDQLRIEVEATKVKGPVAKMKGTAFVNGQVACEGELTCSIMDNKGSGGALIDGSASIHPTAKIGKNVKIGTHSVIGQEVEIGDNTEIGSNVLLARWVKIGSDCKVMHGTSIGTPPQDTKYKGEKTWVTIGDRCTIREFVTIHQPTGEGNVTTIGNDCLLMVHSHIPHNARIGNNVVVGGYVGIAGHAEIDDYVIIGGLSAIHQFVRIGKMSMIGGQSKIVQDVPPFMIADGNPAQVRALNIIGLQRRGISMEAQVELKKAFKVVFRSGNNLSQAINHLKKDCKPLDEIKCLISFIEKETDRGILRKTETDSDLLFPDVPELGI